MTQTHLSARKGIDKQMFWPANNAQPSPATGQKSINTTDANASSMTLVLGMSTPSGIKIVRFNYAWNSRIDHLCWALGWLQALRAITHREYVTRKRTHVIVKRVITSSPAYAVLLQCMKTLINNFLQPFFNKGTFNNVNISNGNKHFQLWKKWKYTFFQSFCSNSV